VSLLNRGLVIYAVVLTGCLPASTPGTTVPGGPIPPGGRTVEVLRVYDGDTFQARTAEGSLEVRLDGMNAPDRGECFHPEATDALVDLLEDREVTMLLTGVDQFGRTLALVRTEDTDINLSLIASGHAIATTPLIEDARGLEEAARSQGLGLWGPEACGTGPLPEILIDAENSVFDPPGPDDQHLDQELVVLVNPGPTPVDLSGWTLRDESSRHRFTMPDTTLAPGERLIVTSADPGWSPGGSPVWNNDGDIVMLLDRHGRVVASHRYGGGR
jgi:micrococcal nuclease